MPQKRSWRPPGTENNSLVSSGRPPEEFLGEISPPQGGPEAAFGPLGLMLALLMPVGAENAKILKFANTPYENLDFEGSGSLPGLIF